MKKLRNKRVYKLTVKELKEKLNEMNDDSEVVLGFYLKDQPNHFVYLADICEIGYDSVKKESTFNSKIVELMGYDDRYCSYMEKKND